MSAMDASNEDALRVYIDERLLDYALTHLTVDYISFTENTVIDLLTKSLVKVPTTDPHSLALPLDPLEALFRCYNLNQLSQYEEKWTADEDSLNCIRQVVAVSGKDVTERWWLEEASREFETNYAIRRPLSPILTTCAKRATPVLGSKRYPRLFPLSYSDGVKSTLLAKVVEDQVITPPPNLELDSVLNMKIVLDTETRSQIVSLLTSVSFRDTTYMNKCIEAFLHVSDPLPSLPCSEFCFIPVFPQSQILGGASSSMKFPAGLKDFDGVASLCPPVEIGDDAGDLHKEHMVVVDGLQFFPASSSTPTSSQLDQDQDLDELFTRSSPNTDLTPIQMLMNAKLEEIEVPRIRKLGGTIEESECTGNRESLASFLLPRIHAPQQRAIAALSSPSISLVEQVTSGNAHPSCLGEYLSEDFDAIASRIYACVRDHGPEDPIMSEKLEEKDGQLLDVPNLPAPNVHLESGVWLPDSLSSLVDVPQHVQTTTTNIGQNRWLRKAKGSHSLAMTLSWIPFRSSMKDITHDHGADVLEFDGGFRGGCDADELQGVPRSESVWPDAGDGKYQTKLQEFSYATDGSELALTREERRRSCRAIDNSIDELDTHTTHHQDTNKHIARRHALDSDAAISAFPTDHVSNNLGSTETAFRCASDIIDSPVTSFLHHDDHLTRDDSSVSFFSSHCYASQRQPRGSFECLSNTHETIWPPDDEERELDSFFPLPRGNSPSAETSTTQEFPEKAAGTTSSSRTPGNVNAEIASAVVEFARLRSKIVPESTLQGFDSQVLPVVQGTADNSLSGVPDELIDSKTMCLEWPQPNRMDIHRYLASMDIVQKQSLVRALRGQQCLVDLIERETLGGVDIVIDPFTAIIFLSLHALPSQCDSLVANLGFQSWRYSCLLVVLEAYPERQSYESARVKTSRLKLNSYTTPNIKAVKKMRRDLGIAEGFGIKSTACTVYVSFANNVDEAALITRSFGEYAEANDDTQGALWGTREWLDYAPHENEQDLAFVEGMNAFAAFVILSQISLQDFLDSTAEYRLNEFGSLIGVHRVDLLNRVLGDRHHVMESMRSSETMEDLCDTPLWVDKQLAADGVNVDL